MKLPATVNESKLGHLPIITIDNQFAQAEISLFGGHVISFVPKHDGRERLWLSPNAILDGNKPIRGGIPVCWPWFSDTHGRGNVSLPSHGYVRDQVWHISACNEDLHGTELVIRPATTKGPGSAADVALELTISVGKKLTLQLTTINSGDEPFPLGCALHSYFAVNDIQQTTIEGINGKYKDKTNNWALAETPVPYDIVAETDRIHISQAKEVSICQPSATSKIYSSGHDSIVVWNPWSELSKSMADMPDNGYQTMLCIESAVTQGKVLESGESHTLMQSIG